jgi:hypothetical protein
VKVDNDHEWHEPGLPFPAPIFAALRHFYRAAGLSRHVAENAEFEQVSPSCTLQIAIKNGLRPALSP